MGTPVYGQGNVGSYLLAGNPYITGSTVAPGSQDQIDFDCVTRRIVVKKTTADGIIYIHFQDDTLFPNVTANNHFIKLNDEHQEFEMFVKSRNIFISNPATSANPAGYEVFAELTPIAAARMVTHSGSGIDE